jgi:acetyltransferase-like isoleucine patch superfamily enzyme
MSSPSAAALLETLRSLHGDLRSSMRERFDRDLPLEELVFDRWERARELGFGERASIYHNSYVFGNVRVGANTWIGPFVMLDGSGGMVEIGEWCCISTGVQVYTHDTVERSLTGGRAPATCAPVRIGDRSYVGSQSVILPGVTIGDHCVLGAGSIVNRDVPSHSIAVGIPARVRGRVELDPAGERAELKWDS